MKKLLFFSLSIFWGFGALAQVDQGRDLSKYADDKFRDDDKYSVAEPYQTVSVSQPKSRKVKNIIFMIGDGMGVEQRGVFGEVPPLQFSAFPRHAGGGFAAVAVDLGGHALQKFRAVVRILQLAGLVVGVGIDESGSDHLAGAVDPLRFCRVEFAWSPDVGDPPVFDKHLAGDGGRTGAVADCAGAKNDFFFHRISLKKPMMLLGRSAAAPENTH